jgi:uncharacterized membrane protein
MRALLSEHWGVPQGLLVGVALYTAILTYLTWVQYENLRDPTFDMGVNVQICASVLQTGLPLETANWAITNGRLSTNFFGIHFSPVKYLFAAAYLLHPGAVTLLFLQALFVALGSLPTYKLSRYVLKDQRISLLLSALYLVFPPTIMANLYDVHEEAIIPFALLSAYYFSTSGQYNKAVLFFIFTGLIQESADALLFFTAIQLMVVNRREFLALIRHHRWTRGIALAVCVLIASPAAFLLENSLFLAINPSVGFIPTATTAYGISIFNLTDLFLQKLGYWFVLLAFTGFLPFASKKTSIMAIPWFTVSLFGNNPNFSSLYWQYNFLIVPALFVGMIYGLNNLSPSNQIWAGFARMLRIAPSQRSMLTVLLVIFLVFCPLYPSLAPYLQPGPHVVQAYLPPSNDAQLAQLYDLIPNGAPVLASDFLFAHVAKSINVYPIILVHNSTSQRNYLATTLPRGFTPEFVIILSTDYNATVQLVESFPQNYSLIRFAQPVSLYEENSVV